MRRFTVGEVVTWIPDLQLRYETHGDYRITAAMPDRDGERMYRIKSPFEEYERVAKEASARQIRRPPAGRTSGANFAPSPTNHAANTAATRQQRTSVSIGVVATSRRLLGARQQSHDWPCCASRER